MYASQTKRLCVRGAPSDETTKVQQQQQQQQSTTTTNTNTEASSNQETILRQSNTRTQPQPHLLTSSSSSTSPSSTNMTASALSNDSTLPLSAKQTNLTSHSANHNSQNFTNESSSLSVHNDETAFAAAMAAASMSGDTTEQELINRLACETLEETKLEIILSIRNIITACNKKKDSLINNPNFRKIINLIDDESNSNQVKTQIALLLCSLAKAGEHNIEILNQFMVDDKILNLILKSHDQTLIEACLRCLRALMSCPGASRFRSIYEVQSSIENSNLTEEKHNSGLKTGSCSTKLQKIIACAQESNSFIIQECVADIFAATCDPKSQAVLLKSSALSCIVNLLQSPSHKVVAAGLGWLTQMCTKNQQISQEVMKMNCPSGQPVLDVLASLMSKDNCNSLQFLSARCLAHIYRVLDTEKTKEIEPKITTHVLPTLVRMVHKDKSPNLRIKSAYCIAYLIEQDPNLQNTASFCDHLIDSLANMLEYQQNSMPLDVKSFPKTLYKCSRVQDRGVSWLSITSSQPQAAPPPLDLRPTSHQVESSNKSAPNYSKVPTTTNTEFDNDENNSICNTSETSQEMKRAAFLALASLASNLEPIRTKIFGTCSVMQNLVKSLIFDCEIRMLKSVLTCLLSLSRSVQQLRTSFAENSVYCALKGLLVSTPQDVLVLVLAILCNISLDFSPGKQHFLDSKTIEILCDLTKKSDPVMRLHGIWILMNMVYQMKDLNTKMDIAKALDMDHVLNMLVAEKDEEIIAKTLGFLRNMLSQKNHIDNIMAKYGSQILQSLTQMLQKDNSPKTKEHTLCVLTNIADGPESKLLIMDNEVIMDYLARIISDEQGGDLRLAAICCITNLVHKEGEGFNKRRDEMKKLGFEEKLKSMLDTDDPALSDRVRTAYSYFYS